MKIVETHMVLEVSREFGEVVKRIRKVHYVASRQSGDEDVDYKFIMEKGDELVEITTGKFMQMEMDFASKTVNPIKI